MKITATNPALQGLPSTGLATTSTTTAAGTAFSLAPPQVTLARPPLSTRLVAGVDQFLERASSRFGPQFAMAGGVIEGDQSPGFLQSNIVAMTSDGVTSTGSTAASPEPIQLYPRTSRDRLLPNDIVFPYIGPDSRELGLELRGIVNRNNLGPSDLDDFIATLVREIGARKPGEQITALEIGFGYREENIDALLGMKVAVTATEANYEHVSSANRRHFWSRIRKRFRAYTASKFNRTIAEDSPKFDIVILNLPFPREHVRDAVLGVADRVVAPGTFVVLSSDVAFMYFPHFWSNKDEWETVLLERNLPEPLMLTANHNRHGRIGIFRKRI